MRRAVTIIGVIALLGLFAGPAGAVSPPANDEAAGAIVIPSDATLPFSTTEDTTGATANAADDGCFFPATASVWYQYTPSSDGALAVDASASDYGVGVDIFTGTPGSLGMIGCGSPGASFEATAGTTYYLMFAEVDGGTAGGTLAFTLETPPPPPTIHLVISATGSAAPKAGTVTIRGTVDCSEVVRGISPASTGGGPGVEVDVGVSQKVGRVATIQGNGSTFVPCGTGTAWSATVYPYSGLFKPGQVSVQAQAFACDAVGQCGGDFTTAAVRVVKG